jgi:hypothetical protein
MRAALVLLIATSSAGLLGAHQRDLKTPTLEQVLARAANYAVSYGEALSSVLAEEAYTQTLVWRDRGDLPDGPISTRQLQAEIAFVRLAESTEWLTFRNVTSLDGKPIPESRDRLERLFRDPPDTVLAQARMIAAESARYNLGPITREINVPTIALLFVHPAHQDRSRFSRDGAELVDGVNAWIVRFTEKDRGGLISRTTGGAIPARGRLWIVPDDGRIVRSELTLDNFVHARAKSRADVTVAWRADTTLGMWVPSEMREHYDGPSASVDGLRFDINGVATYGNYRRFSTSVRIR